MPKLTTFTGPDVQTQAVLAHDTRLRDRKQEFLEKLTANQAERELIEQAIAKIDAQANQGSG